MAEEQKRSGIVAHAVVALIIAVLIIGAAAWWWGRLFPQMGQAEPAANASERPPSGQTAESLSRTPLGLPGDAIERFRVASLSGRFLTIEVDFRTNEQHGRSVMLGGALKGVPSSFTPAVARQPRGGTGMLTLTANDAGTSEFVEIFLYEGGRPTEPFARRVFPYRIRFE